ncbi:unnamed protein product [Cunninghamella blakesleeana]
MDLSKSMVFGWDPITVIDGNTYTTVKAMKTPLPDNKELPLSLSNKSNNIFSASIISDDIIRKYATIIPKKHTTPSSVTHLMEFSIDKDDTAPIYLSTLRLHPFFKKQKTNEAIK